MTLSQLRAEVRDSRGQSMAWPRLVSEASSLSLKASLLVRRRHPGARHVHGRRLREPRPGPGELAGRPARRTGQLAPCPKRSASRPRVSLSPALAALCAFDRPPDATPGRRPRAIPPPQRLRDGRPWRAEANPPGQTLRHPASLPAEQLLGGIRVSPGRPGSPSDLSSATRNSEPSTGRPICRHPRPQRPMDARSTVAKPRCGRTNGSEAISQAGRHPGIQESLHGCTLV